MVGFGEESNNLNTTKGAEDHMVCRKLAEFFFMLMELDRTKSNG
jgi:hypothetical protein